MRQPDNFKDHIEAFEKMLKRIEINEVSDELYCRKYLTQLLLHKKYYLAIYADVLFKLSQRSSLRRDNISLIDFGAGNGLLGIFAKFCGFGKVYINDIDEKFVSAAKKLSAQLAISIDGFLTGDIGAVKAYFKNDMPGAIIGTDVIEHIYSLENFIQTVQQLNPSMVSVFTTGSNPENPFKVRQLKKIQLKDELEGGEPGDRILFGESSLEPFLNIRKQIIQRSQPGLHANEVIQLAHATRGMHEADICRAAEKYQVSGKFSQPPLDTNTCNPLNGSWTERILPLETYISLYAAAGFTCKFYAGFYNDYETGAGNFVKKMLNSVITILGKKISPYIVIVGYKK